MAKERRENQVAPLEIWDGGLSQYSQHFMTGMQFHGPFIVTKIQARNDLGDCIISTRAPHLVCKVHSFRTNLGRAKDNDRNWAIAEREETARLAWLEQRNQAFENEREAQRQGITIQELIEGQGRVYDEEFDQPRVIVKVPGLNAYLELLGCLDALGQNEWDDIEWTGEHGVLETLNSMAEWAQNIWNSKERRERATRMINMQPMDEWQEEYDPELRPWMPKKRGLGHTTIDPSRRPELLYSKAPQGSADYGMIKELKRAQAENASQGIAPENYGKKH
jgi:hypothetical protein